VRCGIGVLGRPASESGRLRHGDAGHGRGDRRGRGLMLPSLSSQTPSLSVWWRRFATSRTRWRQAVPVPAKRSPTITIGIEAQAVAVAVK
jgi:hypothetical protein